MRIKNAVGALVLLAVGLLAGCGGGSGTPAGGGNVTGQFVDAQVVGLGYKCGTSTTLSGTTNATGQFTCPSGQAVAFYVGDILLGTVPSVQALVTPLDLVGAGATPNDPKVINIVRFLMSISSTSAASGKLTIDPAVVTAATGTTIDFTQVAPANLDAVITAVKPVGAVVATGPEARAHMSSSLLGLFAGSYSGNFSGSFSGTWSITIDSNGVVSGTATDSLGGVGTVSGNMTTTMGTGSTYAFTGTGGGTPWAGNLNVNTRQFSGTWNDGAGSQGTFTGTGTAAAPAAGGTTAGTLMGGAIQGTPLNLTGTVTSFAGSTSAGLTDGTGTAASFNNPLGITTDGSNLYVVESQNSKIRKIVIATVAVTTLAGSGSSGAADGTGTSASFNSPQGITTDGSNLYVTDYGNNNIRKIVIATGAVTTLAGSGSMGFADGTGTAASFFRPDGITTDGSNLYVADGLNRRVRKIVIATGAVTTFAGSGAAGAADGTGTAASFGTPRGITTDGTNLYVTDELKSNIRKIVIATGAVSTVAGSGAYGSADGTGTAATFNGLRAITTDGSNLYVADGGYPSGYIRKIVIATGVVSTPTVWWAQGITTDGSNLYATNNTLIGKIQ